jgi:protein TonB
MVLAESSVKKYVVLSTLLHFGLLATVVWVIPKEDKLIPIEISFGTGNSPGGSGGPAALPKKSIEAPKKIATRNLAPKTKTDDVAIPVEQKEVVQPTTASTPNAAYQAENGKGNGTGLSGTGSGTSLGNGTGEGVNSIRAKYGSMIAKLINDRKRYPRIAKTFHQEGQVLLKLKLDKMGKILELSILEKSIYESLTKASLETIQSVQQFPPIPDELGVDEISLSIPMNYTLQL